VDEMFNYEWPWSVAETAVRDRHARCAQASDMNPASSEAVTQGFSSSQLPGRRHILQFHIPDYSVIPPKVDCWRRNGKIVGENNEVSGALSCSVVRHKGEIWLVSATRSGSIYFSFDLCIFHAYFSETVESRKSQSTIDYQR
jgi:hypothetical protein